MTNEDNRQETILLLAAISCGLNGFMLELSQEALKYSILNYETNLKQLEKQKINDANLQEINDKMSILIDLLKDKL